MNLNIPPFITDHPEKVIGLIRALLIFATAFWPGLFTPEQQVAIIGLAVASLGLTGWTASTTVPKTPSWIDPNLIQTPPPGTVLVTSDSASAASPVSAVDVIAASSVAPDKP